MTALELDRVSLAYPMPRAGGRGVTAPTGAAEDRFLRDGKGRIQGLAALRDVSISLRQGDRLALLGGNGAGKTTLLRVMAGVIPPTAGTVRREGRTTNLINISLGMQDDATGHRNITLRGLAARQDRATIEAKRDEIAEFCGLGEFLDMPVRTYSAGMRMRLNFAIATAFEPEILILDEWLSAGDAAFRSAAEARMMQFADRAGLLILASHNLPLLTRVCTQAILMEGGRVKARGSVEDMLAIYKPAKPKAARTA